MKKSVLAALGLGLTCSACCLPLVAPLLAATGLSSLLAVGLAGVSLDYLLCVIGPWIAGAGVLLALALVIARRQARTPCACIDTCTPGKC